MNENMMTTNDNLMHWGIKGQKWGVRRYQNPDGTLTEEGIRRYSKKYPYQNPDGSLNERGQKEYMTAAKKGKIDLDSLPDKELDMINQRFNRENTFKNNVSKYEESTFEYKLKQAVINRIKGGGGGGGKKGKGGGGKKGGITGIGSLLAMPIKKAFEDAFKTTNYGGGGGADGGNAEDAADLERWSEHGHRITSYYVDKAKWPDVKRGKDHVEKQKRLFDMNSISGDRIETYDGNSNDYMERLLAERRKAREASKRTDEQKRQARERAARKRERELEERAAKSGILIGHSGIKYRVARGDIRSDELMHHGIKGQKWGVRRFQNEDMSLTPAGRERYGLSDDRSSKKFMKLATKSNAYGDSAQKAMKKLLKTDKMKELLNDKQIQEKKEAYDKASSELSRISKGEDYDAYDSKNYNYGIKEKQFKQIKDLTDKKNAAWKDFDNTVRERVKAFTNEYATRPVSTISVEKKKFDDINDWIRIVTVVELGRRK